MCRENKKIIEVEIEFGKGVYIGEYYYEGYEDEEEEDFYVNNDYTFNTNNSIQIKDIDNNKILFKSDDMKKIEKKLNLKLLGDKISYENLIKNDKFGMEYIKSMVHIFNIEVDDNFDIKDIEFSYSDVCNLKSIIECVKYKDKNIIPSEEYNKMGEPENYIDMEIIEEISLGRGK